MIETLYGKNSVLEALRAQRRKHKKMLIASGKQEGDQWTPLIQMSKSLGIPIERIERHMLDNLLGNVNHQGVALQTSAYPYTTLETCLSLAQQRQEMVFLVLLDHVQDPQNIATLIRTAEQVGVHGIILPNRRAAGMTPAVVNASSGASEYLNIVSVTNLDQTIRMLQREGVWVVGVEQDSRAKDFDQVDLNIDVALVLGAEGSGLARLTRERCDFLVQLPTQGNIASLNVAVAGSIILYHVWRQRKRLSLSVPTTGGTK